MNKDLVVSKTITIQADAASVWEALTNPEKIKLFFFGTKVVTKWEVGAPILFQGDYDGKSFEDKGNIIEFSTEKVLQYDYWSSWSRMEDIPENYSLVTYSLEQSADQTVLSVIQQGFASEMNLEHAHSSWDAVLESIKELVEENQ